MKDDVHLTVIATGFDRLDAPDATQYSSRTFDTRAGQQPRPEQPPRPSSNDYKVRTFERDDLDIPAFLRRSRGNGR